MKLKTSLLGGAALGMSLALGLTASASAQDTTVAWKGAPQWTNDDVQFKVRGRLLIDYVFQDVERVSPLPDYQTSNVRGRQAFLGVEGKLNNYLAYKAEGGAVNGGAWSWDDVVIEYKPTEMTSIMVGNIKAAGLENLTSTRFITFLDRGPYGDMGPDSYVLSVVAKANGLNWTATGALQGASINSGDVNNTAGANPGSKERVGALQLCADPDRRDQVAPGDLGSLPQPRRRVGLLLRRSSQHRLRRQRPLLFHRRHRRHRQDDLAGSGPRPKEPLGSGRILRHRRDPAPDRLRRRTRSEGQGRLRHGQLVADGRDAKL
jgi:hypothetical protein